MDDTHSSKCKWCGNYCYDKWMHLHEAECPMSPAHLPCKNTDKKACENYKFYYEHTKSRIIDGIYMGCEECTIPPLCKEDETKGHYSHQFVPNNWEFLPVPRIRNEHDERQ